MSNGAIFCLFTTSLSFVIIVWIWIASIRRCVKAGDSVLKAYLLPSLFFGSLAAMLVWQYYMLWIRHLPY